MIFEGLPQQSMKRPYTFSLLCSVNHKILKLVLPAYAN